ncbi:hypothetical protein, partial [Streptomyces sp. NPDC041003]|uniref:hypothetical protein n=1 Tax=Streptomyces sp. NPDC041003 TaxID=3155730 RepID=UPI0033ED3556
MPLELTCVAELYTTLGDHDRADAAIAAIPDPEERAMACATCIGPAAADHTPAAAVDGRHPRRTGRGRAVGRDRGPRAA